MADIDHRHARLVTQPFEIGQDFRLARASSDARGSSRRRRRGRISSARPMAMRWRSPPDNWPGPARQQMTDAEQVDNACRIRPHRPAAGHAAPVIEVGAPQSYAETAGLPGTRSRCGVLCGGTIHVRFLNRTAPYRRATMRPRSGATRPAIMLTSDGLAGTRNGRTER